MKFKVQLVVLAVSFNFAQTYEYYGNIYSTTLGGRLELPDSATLFQQFKIRYTKPQYPENNDFASFLSNPKNSQVQSTFPEPSIDSCELLVYSFYPFSGHSFTDNTANRLRNLDSRWIDYNYPDRSNRVSLLGMASLTVQGINSTTFEIEATHWLPLLNTTASYFSGLRYQDRILYEISCSLGKFRSESFTIKAKSTVVTGLPEKSIPMNSNISFSLDLNQMSPNIKSLFDSGPQARYRVGITCDYASVYFSYYDLDGPRIFTAFPWEIYPEYYGKMVYPPGFRFYYTVLCDDKSCPVKDGKISFSQPISEIANVTEADFDSFPTSKNITHLLSRLNRTIYPWVKDLVFRNQTCWIYFNPLTMDGSRMIFQDRFISLTSSNFNLTAIKKPFDPLDFSRFNPTGFFTAISLLIILPLFFGLKFYNLDMYFRRKYPDSNYSNGNPSLAGFLMILIKVAYNTLLVIFIFVFSLSNIRSTVKGKNLFGTTFPYTTSTNSVKLEGFDYQFGSMLSWECLKWRNIYSCPNRMPDLMSRAVPRGTMVEFEVWSLAILGFFGVAELVRLYILVGSLFVSSTRKPSRFDFTLSSPLIIVFMILMKSFRKLTFLSLQLSKGSFKYHLFELFFGYASLGVLVGFEIFLVGDYKHVGSLLWIGLAAFIMGTARSIFMIMYSLGENVENKMALIMKELDDYDNMLKGSSDYIDKIGNNHV